MSEWNNELIIEFIQNYEAEPIIWDPYNKNHKQKKLVNEAWKRLVSNLSFKTTVETVKRKKDSLMAYYRIHLTKIKKAKQDNEVYQTQWFAFEAMHSFLGPIYECKNSIISVEEQENESSAEEEWLSSSSPTPMVITTPSETQERQFPKKKKRNMNRGTVLSENTSTLEINEPFDLTDNVGNSMQNKDDEYDLFGKLIASKLRKIQDSMDREIVMNEMMTLAFKARFKPETVRNKSAAYRALYTDAQFPNASTHIKSDPLNNMSPDTRDSPTNF